MSKAWEILQWWFFLSFLKHGNILLLIFPYHITIFYKKSRKKQERSKRFSGGIIIAYKTILHKWYKRNQSCNIFGKEIMDETWHNSFFNLSKDICTCICACFILIVSYVYNTNDVSEQEMKLFKITSANTCNVLLQ